MPAPKRPFRGPGKQPDRFSKPGHKPQPKPGSKPTAAKSQDRGWDRVAAWYDKLVGSSGSDYHRNVILPATLRLLGKLDGLSAIDVCCGQGVLIEPLLKAGVAHYVGVDASPRLIQSAKQRHAQNRRVTLLTADVCHEGPWNAQPHDVAACLMAVHDVPDAAAMFRNIRKALKPGGKALFVLMHPCFRIPQHSHWGWDNDQKVQFRRIDRYHSSPVIPITTHPGKQDDSSTAFHHRTLADLITGLGQAGLAVTGCEELYTHRRSQAGGPFSKAEHRAAEEIPVFMALLAEALPR